MMKPPAISPTFKKRLEVLVARGARGDLHAPPVVLADLFALALPYLDGRTSRTAVDLVGWYEAEAHAERDG